MKKTMLRIVAMLLALLMALGTLSLVSCADDTEEEKTPDEQTPEGDTPTDEEIPKEPQEERLSISYLPTTTYGGAQIHVLEWSANGQTDVGSGWIPWEDIDVDTIEGDSLTSAIYDRNGAVEELYDVVITKEYVSVDGATNYSTVFRANESSGDEGYQMITLRTADVAPFCLEGLMTDMNELSYLHTQMPWWSQDSVKSYAMGNALYFAAPEMLLRDKGAASLVFFNQKVADDEGIEDLFEVARMGEWTVEMMIELSENVAADLDGDDLINSSDDMYGLFSNSRDLLHYLYMGSGNKFARVNEDGYVELTIGKEDNLMIWQDILEDVLYTDFYFQNTVDPALVPEGYDPFKADRCLFFPSSVKTVLGLRDMSSAYGVLPIPKYDIYQEEYASLVWMHHDCVLGIPGSCTNTDMISTVLEHMSYISYYDVYPIFYDTVILGKSARDEQSKQMLELVFKTRAVDPGMYLMVNESWIFTVMHDNRVTNVASTWASISSMFEARLKEINDKIDELQ